MTDAKEGYKLHVYRPIYLVPVFAIGNIVKIYRSLSVVVLSSAMMYGATGSRIATEFIHIFDSTGELLSTIVVLCICFRPFSHFNGSETISYVIM